MGAGQDARRTVKRAFPGRDALIDRSFSVHRSFRELCQDYRNCAVALERWRRLSDDEPSQRAREYAELLAELACEIEAWLGAIDFGAAHQRRGDPR